MLNGTIPKLKVMAGRPRGSSLLELVLVLVVISVVASASIPRSIELYTKANIRIELNKVRGFFERALLRSASFQREYFIEVSEAALKLTDRSSKRVIDSLVISSPVYIDMSQSKATLIRLRPNGANSPFTLRLRTEYASCKLILSLRGRVKETCS